MNINLPSDIKRLVRICGYIQTNIEQNFESTTRQGIKNFTKFVRDYTDTPIDLRSSTESMKDYLKDFIESLLEIKEDLFNQYTDIPRDYIEAVGLSQASATVYEFKSKLLSDASLLTHYTNLSKNKLQERLKCEFCPSTQTIFVHQAFLSSFEYSVEHYPKDCLVPFHLEINGKVFESFTDIYIEYKTRWISDIEEVSLPVTILMTLNAYLLHMRSMERSIQKFIDKHDVKVPHHQKYIEWLSHLHTKPVQQPFLVKGIEVYNNACHDFYTRVRTWEVKKPTKDYPFILLFDVPKDIKLNKYTDEDTYVNLKY